MHMGVWACACWCVCIHVWSDGGGACILSLQPGLLCTDDQLSVPTDADTPALGCQKPVGAGAAASKSRPEAAEGARLGLVALPGSKWGQGLKGGSHRGLPVQKELRWFGGVYFGSRDDAK